METLFGEIPKKSYYSKVTRLLKDYPFLKLAVENYHPNLFSNRGIEDKQKVVELIDKVLTVLSEEQKRMIDLCYFKRRMLDTEVMAELSVGRHKLYKMKYEVIKQIAKVLNLL